MLQTSPLRDLRRRAVFVIGFLLAACLFSPAFAHETDDQGPSLKSLEKKIDRLEKQLTETQQSLKKVSDLLVALINQGNNHTSEIKALLSNQGNLARKAAPSDGEAKPPAIPSEPPTPPTPPTPSVQGSSKVVLGGQQVDISDAPSLGSPDAKVTVIAFSDFECPFCARGATILDRIKKEYAGKVRIVFKHLPLSFHQNAHAAAQASMAAHAQGKFWEYHDGLFKNFRSLNKDTFLRLAKETGLDVARFQQDLDSGKFKAYVDADAQTAAAVGVQGTPTFYVNDHQVVGAQPFDRFKNVIDAILAGRPLPTQGARQPSPPRPAPGTRQTIEIGSAPTFGPATAKITIIEFSDFECPFCSRGAATIDQIKKEYAGQVRVAFKHLPLSFHKNAHEAAQASMAAHAQGKFWEYHDALFKNFRTLGKDTFLRLARETGLDVVRFQQDLDSGKFKAHVDADLKQASSAGANGTPTFFVNGVSVVGAQPFARFKQIIDAELSGQPIPSDAPPRPAAPPLPPGGRRKVEIGGAPTWGPADAKITIVEFSDFECPFCSRGAATIDQLKKDYAGKIRLVFKHLPLPFHANAHGAAQASMAAHAQGKFWEYHDLLFKNFRTLNKETFLRLAREVGLDLGKFQADLDSGKYKAYVDADSAQAASVGANGTPTFFLNGYEIVGAHPIARFKQVLDAELAGKPIPAEPQDEPQAPPQPSGPVKIDVGAAPTWGPADAKVTIVEFSDFECPFCGRGAATIDQVKKEYAGKVRIVFKHLPLSFHPNAHAAAQASMAAHAQGKFWEFHDLLFKNFRSLSKEAYLRFAKELGLDVVRFQKDLDSEKYKDLVDADLKQASSSGANGTPTFFINGKSLVGAQPFDAFKQRIDEELKAAK